MKTPVLITSGIHLAALMIYSLFMADYMNDPHYNSSVVLTTFALTWIVTAIVSVWVCEINERK